MNMQTCKMRCSRLIGVIKKYSTPTTPLSSHPTLPSYVPQKFSRSNYWTSSSTSRTNSNTSTTTTTKRNSIRYYHEQTSTPTATTMRLSKRMAHLDLCSRREADRLISQGMVHVRGKKIEPILGQKVDSEEMDISIVGPTSRRYAKTKETEEEKDEVLDPWDWDRIRGDTIVLNKPTGYVSGQPDPRHGHIPAVRLLTRPNLYLGGDANDATNEDNNNVIGDNIAGDVDEKHREARETLRSGRYFNFGRMYMDNRDFPPSPRSRAPLRNNDSYNDNGNYDDDYTRQRQHSHRHESVSTLLNYAPAGRLDLDSSGLLIFTRNGVIAKRLLTHSNPLTHFNTHDSDSSSSTTSTAAANNVHREYLVRVEPVESLSRIERSMGMMELPYPPRWDLRSLTRVSTGNNGRGRGGGVGGGGGNILWDDDRPLKPLVSAEWVVDKGDDNKQQQPKAGEEGWDGRGTLRLVLQEGRKRQIRRMCRELLGLHVVDLVRVRIGSVVLDDLPEGRWRPLRREEVQDLLGDGVTVSDYAA